MIFHNKFDSDIGEHHFKRFWLETESQDGFWQRTLNDITNDNIIMKLI